MTPALRGNAARAAAVALLLLVLPTVLAKGEEPVRPTAYAAVDGVTYYLVAGMVNGSMLASDPGTGDSLLMFSGCALVQLRPELDRGRISVAGLVDGVTPLSFDVGDFEGDAARQGPLAANLTLDPALHPLLPPGKTARGEVAGEGVTQVFAAEYLDTSVAPPRFRKANFTDPIGGGDELRAVLAMANDGVRDDGTGALRGEVARDDDELHVVLLSPDGAAPDGDSFTFASAPALPDGSAMPDSEYTASYELLNTRFGGQATLTMDFQSKALPGSNQLTILVRAPDGAEVGNATVESSALAAGTTTLSFATDQMGFYTVLVTGKMMLSSYTIDVTLEPPASFRLDFWWEDVVRGAAAPNAWGECQKELGLRAQVVAGKVDRARPPTFPMEIIVLAVAATVATLLLVLKLVVDQVSSEAFRKQFKK